MPKSVRGRQVSKKVAGGGGAETVRARCAAERRR